MTNSGETFDLVCVCHLLVVAHLGEDQRSLLVQVHLREFIDYTTSFSTCQDPLRGFGGKKGLEFSHALPVGAVRGSLAASDRNNPPSRSMFYSLDVAVFLYGEVRLLNPRTSKATNPASSTVWGGELRVVGSAAEPPSSRGLSHRLIGTTHDKLGELTLWTQEG